MTEITLLVVVVIIVIIGLAAFINPLFSRWTNLPANDQFKSIAAIIIGCIIISLIFII